MKKLYSLSLAAVMITLLFCGCTNNNDGNSGTATTTTPGSAATATPSAMPTVTPDSDPTDTVDPNGAAGAGLEDGNGTGNAAADMGRAIDRGINDMLNPNNDGTRSPEPTAGGQGGSAGKR